MSSINWEEVVAAFDALDAVMTRLQDLCFDGLTTPERLALLQRCEVARRRLPSIEHPLINQLGEQAGEQELGGKLAAVLAGRLRVSRGEASRRLGEAADLGPRRALTGEQLAPLLSATASAVRQGRIGAGHVRVIREFCGQVPAEVDLETRERAEAHLARLAGQFRPDQLAKLAQRLMDCVNPDGRYSDEDRARRRGLTLGRQGRDGMSRISGWLTPEARAGLDAVLAKLAAPGMCNPDDESPVVQAPAGADAVSRDRRSVGQRHHDGLNAAVRALLASGDLGQHNGLPASIIVTTTRGELQRACGRGLTGGGTVLPISDVIRLARHAHHYLAVFDRGKAVGLHHAKRLATAGHAWCCMPKTVVAPVRAVMCRAINARCIMSPRGPPAGAPTSINSLWPAGLTTNCSSRVGALARTPTVIPNGCHRRTSTMDSQEPTPTTTPKNCSATAQPTKAKRGVDRAVVWHAEPMAGKEIDRVRATSALAVIKQHPAMVLFVLSPALALLAVIWWLAGAGWAIAAALAVLVVGVAVVVRKR